MESVEKFEEQLKTERQKINVNTINYSTREIEILPQSDRAHTASYFRWALAQ